MPYRHLDASLITSLRWMTACLSLAVVSGCGPSSLESTVTGTVTLDGTAIGPGVIQFVPVGSAHNPATGTIDVDGSYELKTSNQLGLSPGDYQVTVAVYDQPEVAPGQRAAPGSAPLRTPKKYLSVRTTDLKFKVESGVNEINVTLFLQ